MSIATIAADSAVMEAVNIRPMEMDIVSLDDRLLQAFSGSAIATAVDKQTITNRIEDPNLVTDPKELAISQEMISDYNLYVSMISTLTRKGVGAVETLLRS
ncbi:type III secretion system inner rod protein PrgJ [Salmonella enterica subsp. salamae]|nr:type III secretion system inner rod protein PrgJ [Salmonella enterica subsp. salamae]ECJ2281842.1 type III secretion system inner rod protein PrgJ [Salmonella enterica subsp. salamae]HCC0888682.1 type III secretion system inner rod protein PrgJ [Salmonella enterica]